MITPVPPADTLLRVRRRADVRAAGLSAVGLVYLVLSVRVAAPDALTLAGLFCVVVVVGAAIGMPLHRRHYARVQAWLDEATSPVPETAWSDALSLPLRQARLQLFGGLAMSAVAAFGTAALLGGEIGVHVFVAGAVASTLGAAWVALTLQEGLRPVVAAMYERGSDLPLRRDHIEVLGVGQQVAIMQGGMTIASIAMIVGAGTRLGRDLAGGRLSTGEHGLLLALVAGVVGLGIVAAVHRALASWIAPLSQLADAIDAAERAPQDQGFPRLPVHTGGEAGQLADSVNRMLGGLEERRRLDAAFRQYHPAPARRVAARGDLVLGGKELDVTVLIADLRGFTTMCEELAPEQVVAVLEVVFTAWVEEIDRHGGFVDKFIGDAVLAVYGAQAGDEPDRAAADACRTALALRTCLHDVNATLRDRGLPAVDATVAVHRGPTLVGHIGTAHRKDFTVVGDTVNSTARVEGATRTLGVPVLVTAAARADLGDDAVWGEPAEIGLRGRRGRLTVYPLWSPGEVEDAGEGEANEDREDSVSSSVPVPESA